MRSGWAWMLACGAMGGFAPSPGSAQETATTRELEELPSRVANRTAQRDLLSVFEPVDRFNSGMYRQLRGAIFFTKTFGTEYNGLCRRDVVSLSYAATERAAKPEDAPLRPYSVEAQAWFHVTHLPRKVPSDAPRGDGVWQTKCQHVGDSKNMEWFVAKDAKTAVQGVLMLQAAVDAVRSGKLEPAPCPPFYDAGEAYTCKAAILANGVISKIGSVEACSADPEALCYVVDLTSSTKLTIRGRASQDSLAPSAIMSIAVEQYIIVT